jgi:hypothetical protein
MMPQTGTIGGGTNQGYMARVNFMTDDPSNTDRFFVNDLNGPLYILDKTTKQFTEYLNFNGVDSAPGLFDRLYYNQGGFAAGFITFQFDPDYANNGKFYTVHMESGTSGSQVPSNASYPGLVTTNYGPTTSVDAPGAANRQTVLVEWTDTNVNNSIFEGSVRELLRMDMRDRIHPMGDIIFNPTAGPDDDDWRVMYISVGDAGNGEQSASDVRRTPQLLNALGGKILRIVSDDTAINIDTTLSPNGKYYIPNDNPFTGIANSNVRDEIWALGLRNPHRMAWDVDPANPDPETNNHLIVNDIGLRTWEEVNIIHKGANYGYSEREGNQRLISSGPNEDTTTSLPNPDTIPNNLICTGGTGGFSNCTSSGTVTPVYPVLEYGHGLAGQDQVIAGDAVSSGFVYRGSKIPQLYGKYLFGDITTGAIFYADFAEMLAADDGDPSTLATIHSLDVLWDDPLDGPDQGEQLYTTLTSENAIRGPMFQIVHRAYIDRTGLPEDSPLPQGAAVTGDFGRSDIRIGIDADGELYIFSKSDGWIREIVGPERIPGDYNDDGVVTAADYDEWQAAFGTAVPMAGLGADGNEDGFVDAADYTVWRDRVMGGGGGSASHSVPEPASGLLLTAAGLLAAMYRPIVPRRKVSREHIASSRAAVMATIHLICHRQNRV